MGNAKENDPSFYIQRFYILHFAVIAPLFIVILMPHKIVPV